MIPFISHSEKGKIWKENKSVIAKSWKWGEGLNTKGQHEGIFRREGIVLNLDYADGLHCPVQFATFHEIIHQKK